MEFKLEKDFLEKRLKQIKMFTVKEEKSVLLNIDEENISISDISEIVLKNSNLTPLNELEAVALIIKASEISVQDVKDQMFECQNCNAINEIQINLESIINTNFESDIPIGLFAGIDDIIENADDLVLKEYNRLQDKIQENNDIILKLYKDIPCRKCKENNIVTINPLQFISRVSIASFYDEVFQLMYYLHISPTEIESMYPFERELMLGMLKKKVETQPTLSLGA
jgi:hypothetical protein